MFCPQNITRNTIGQAASIHRSPHPLCCRGRFHHHPNLTAFHSSLDGQAKTPTLHLPPPLPPQFLSCSFSILSAGVTPPHDNTLNYKVYAPKKTLKDFDTSILLHFLNPPPPPHPFLFTIFLTPHFFRSPTVALPSPPFPSHPLSVDLTILSCSVNDLCLWEPGRGVDVTMIFISLFIFIATQTGFTELCLHFYHHHSTPPPAFVSRPLYAKKKGGSGSAVHHFFLPFC